MISEIGVETVALSPTEFNICAKADICDGLHSGWANQLAVV